MATETLQEFLVSVRYAVDASSEQALINGLKRIGTSVTGVAAELIGLAAAILKLTEHFAKAGEQFYFMSQRLGSSVSDIQAATLAMTDLGASTEEARGSMEALGRFSRSYGPIATQFLAQIGITASGTEGRLRQLGDFLRSMGGAPGQEGTMGYAMAMRWARMFGIDENTMRAIASPEYGQQLDIAHRIQRGAFGVQTEAQRQQAMDRTTAQAHQMMNLFRQFGFMFGAVMQVFSGRLFTALQPQLEHLFRTISDWVPTINKVLGALADVLGVVMAGFNALLDGLNALASLMQPMLGHIDGLTVALGGLAAVMLTNPIGQFIAAFVLLMGVVADFAAYMKGGRHLFNWEGLRDLFGSVSKWIDDWTDSIGRFIGKWLGFDPESNKKWSEMIDKTTKWLADLTGWDLSKTSFMELINKFTQFVADVTGFDISKTKGLMEFFEAWAKWLNPIQQVQGAWAEFVNDMARLAGLLGGKGGEKALRELASDFVDAINPTKLVSDTWSSIKNSIEAIKKLLTPSEWGNLGGGGGDNLGTWWRQNAPGWAGGGYSGGGTKMTGGQEVGLRQHWAQLFGLSEDVAAGMVATTIPESGGDPTAVEGGRPYMLGGSGGLGRFQWTGQDPNTGRRARLELFALEHGKDPRDADLQDQFMQWELAKYYPTLLARMRAAKTPEEAWALFHKEYVAGGDPRLMAREGGIIAEGHRIAGEGAHPLAPPPSAHTPAPAATAGAGGPEIHLNMTNTFQVGGATPADTAKAIGFEQDRVNENAVRIAKGAYR